MAEPTVLLERRDRIALLTLNRPDALNAFDRAMYADFNDALADVADDDAVWAVVIAAAGDRAFSAGVDLKALDRDLAETGSTEGYGPLAITQTMVTAKPVIAAVHGHCVGEGVALALAADLVVASADAQFSVPEARIGINPVDIPLLLARKLGYGDAFALLTATEATAAEEARQLGLVHLVVPAGTAREAALTLAETMTGANAPLALQAIKETLVRSVGEGADAGRAAGSAWRARLLKSADFAEGRRAFAEKRPPRFAGR